MWNDSNNNPLWNDSNNGILILDLGQVLYFIKKSKKLIWRHTWGRMKKIEQDMG